MSEDYSPKRIREKWQAYWDEHKTFSVPNPRDAAFDTRKPKFYALDFFPYPSGAGLHVGHPEGYTATDIIARYKRMRGYNVLHPMGWDAFGLPAEQHAVETGQHPALTTARNIATFKRQLKSLGFSYDWDREFATTDPDYYRWTQWIFLKLFDSWYDDAADKARPISELPIPAEIKAQGEKAVRQYVDGRRLAYLDEVPVNWCPALGTVLANEEVTSEGRSDRGDHPVFRRPLRQWMLRITKYADRLARDLDQLDWPESVKLMQRNWIGRSEGADVDFKVDGSDDVIRVYTTRPDTLFGATYMVLAPEHPLVAKLTTPDRRAEVEAYCRAAAQRTDLARTAESKEKTGVFTGAYALNPVWPADDPRARIPIWVADYVLMGYGTGAIMCVPASDWRDYDFATKYGLPIIQVVSPNGIEEAAQGVYAPEEQFALYGEAKDASGRKYVKIDFGCFAGDGFAINSPPSGGPPPNCGTGVSPVSSITEGEHITTRNLPHIQKGGSTYFVTFRVRSGQLTPEERDITLKACEHWHGSKVSIHALVVMPDHVHLLMTPHEREPGQWVPLAEILHSIKSYSAHQIDKKRQQRGSIWLDEHFDRIVRNQKEFIEKWEYIEANPVTADLVKEPQNYRWLVLRSDVEPEPTEHRRDAGATVCCCLNGLSTVQAKKEIVAWLAKRGLGQFKVNYKLRDWLFSRQRYWGEPFPILHGPDGEMVALDESELPLTLPEIDDYRPTPSAEDAEAMPEPPLGRARSWATVQRGGKTYKRELNTMPQWAGSCWYYLRFTDPKCNERLCGEATERYWMAGESGNAETPTGSMGLRPVPSAFGGVDLYLGGAEHAVLHLLYARFWHKVLYDLGYVSTPEPFQKLYNQGMIRAYAYRDSRGMYVSYDEIDFREDGAVRKSDGEKLAGAVEKMSKSMKNVINPDEVVEEYGADTLRLYEMFMGPLDASKPWNPRDVPGVFRFLQRTWRLIVGDGAGGLAETVKDGQVDQDLERRLHKTIKKVTEDVERMAFNTAISAMMEFVNEAYRAKGIHKTQAERLVLILSPFAPHLCEELWQRLQGKEWKDSLMYQPWPTFDPALVVDEEVEIPVQVNGRLVGRVTVPKDASQEAVRRAAMAEPKVAEKLGGATIVREVFVPGRLMNFVVKK